VGILALGFLLANFLSRAALLLAVNEELPVPRLVAGTVRLLVNVLAFAMAMEQLGIARNTVTVAFAIAFGALMLGLALAFGLGGKDLARELLAKRFKRQDPDPQDGLHHL
jgi:small-conductance mechanosensitive channel